MAAEATGSSTFCVAALTVEKFVFGTLNGSLTKSWPNMSMLVHHSFPSSSHGVKEWSGHHWSVRYSLILRTVYMYAYMAGSVVPFGNQPVGVRKCYHIPLLLIKLT